MKKLVFMTFLGLTLVVSCNKENPAISKYKDITEGVDISKFSDSEKLEYFAKIDINNYELHNFSIKKINNSPVSENQKANFEKDKIEFNTKPKFYDKTKFFGIVNHKIEISDTKKDGYFSTNDASIFISGYFNEGKFYFTEINKLGY
ncbi:hypothetical protein [Chryseobacterium sp. NFX27]|uniref:hypothetical protein n=1 Tax=Chryseobacterium sp. NFX27 TaxID=2819618 RepID=UPI003CF8AD3C